MGWTRINDPDRGYTYTEGRVTPIYHKNERGDSVHVGNAVERWGIGNEKRTTIYRNQNFNTAKTKEILHKSGFSDYKGKVRGTNANEIHKQQGKSGSNLFSTHRFWG